MSVYAPVQNLPQPLRDRHLGSLPEPQEWFLEELVRSGDIWECPGKGYAVFDGDTLVEFFTMDSDDAHQQLTNLIQQRPFKKGLCTSFDHVLMGAADRLGWTMVETGYLFRKRTPVSLEDRGGFRLVRAKAGDLAEAWTMGREFYDSPGEIEQLFQSGGLWIGVHQGQMVANAVAIPIDRSGGVVDVGMVTRPDQRNKGFASLAIAKLADLLDRDGKRAICGCAHTNRASKAALEKAGFVCEHRLVRIEAPD